MSHVNVVWFVGLIIFLWFQLYWFSVYEWSLNGFLLYRLRANGLVFMGIEVWLQVWLGYRFGVYGYGGQR